eukprot:scaffold3375_cov101-Isochrysis_galbana.AAC.2
MGVSAPDLHTRSGRASAAARGPLLLCPFCPSAVSSCRRRRMQQARDDGSAWTGCQAVSVLWWSCAVLRWGNVRWLGGNPPRAPAIDSTVDCAVKATQALRRKGPII